ncbi:B12-binding domain-containing radical SAM protein [Phosphitispora fastidiosa]|uniref:B12-binding domain-containing radical SAM protein n=1 Tax=Phosphitispora fastidiosa TaxID=2837202 RepID=UPI001E332BBA|nr:cobalamin-dependent protein [Phosphitispora fastidiosa]MBU7006714.1 magnesium-protoporphyrin IX monomethyl ester anaerobic oxidative cyclase [Phosphitispora fastidiosa]
MSLNILLVTPPYHTGIIEVTGKWPPLSLVYLAGHLRANGFQVKIYDAMSLDHDINDVSRVISEENPDVIMIGGFTSSINAAVEVLKAAKDINPDMVTCLGGIHATFCGCELLKEMPGIIDYIVRGEGEQTAVELAQAISDRETPDHVRGLAWLADGAVIMTPEREFTKEMDHLIPAWDLLDWNLYKYNVTGRRLALVGLSRGCPHSCSFCSQHLFWKGTYRTRTPENFVAELEMLHRDYGVGMFMMADEFATCEPEVWERVLDLLITKGLDIHISLETRADAVVRDSSILHKYRQAGIVHVYVGVETVHQKTMDGFGKGLTVDISRRAIDLLNRHDIITECSFIIGNPGDTEEDIETTLQTALDYASDLAHFLLLTPWPYTEMYDQVREYIVENDYSKYHFVYPVIKPAQMEIPRLWSALVNCFRVFYLNKVQQLVLMEDGFKKDYMLKSVRIMHTHFFVNNFGKNTISLPAEMGNIIDSIIGMSKEDGKMLNEKEVTALSSELDADIVEFIQQGLDNNDEEKFNLLALREFRIQFMAGSVYREYCEKQERTPETVSHWSEIPAIPTSAFKEHIITSFPLKDAELALLTSGTTEPGMRGKIYRDKPSLDMILKANKMITKSLLFPDIDRMRILLLVPSPKVAPAMAMAFGLEQMKNEFGTDDSMYLITPNGFETEALIEALREAEESGAPVTLVGATSGFVHFFNGCIEKGLAFRLPEGSRLCDGGGYQGTFGDCSRNDFYARCAEYLGVPPHMCINTLGMSESGTNYFDNTIRNFFNGVAEKERYKVALPWTRTVVVGPRTGQRLPEGEIGLIRHYDLTNRATVLAVQTDNIGYETEGGFEIIGRAQGNLLGFGLEPTSVKDWILAGHREDHSAAGIHPTTGHGHPAIGHGHPAAGDGHPGQGCSAATAEMLAPAHGAPCSTVADGMMRSHGAPCSTVADGMMKAHGAPCSTVADGMMKAHGAPCSTVADGMIKGKAEVK